MECINEPAIKYFRSDLVVMLLSSGDVLKYDYEMASTIFQFHNHCAKQITIGQKHLMLRHLGEYTTWVIDHHNRIKKADLILQVAPMAFFPLSHLPPTNIFYNSLKYQKISFPLTQYVTYNMSQSTNFSRAIRKCCANVLPTYYIFFCDTAFRVEFI